MIHFLALTPVFFGPLKLHPKFPLPNFSLWEPQLDDVRLNIRSHWSSSSLQLPGLLGSGVGLGAAVVITTDSTEAGMKGGLAPL
jgi:hypothetical protein